MLRSDSPNKKTHSRPLSKVADSTRSQKILSKHHPSNSYSASTSEKKLEPSRQPSTRAPSHQSSDRQLKPTKKKIIHKKSSSTSDKPLNQILTNLRSNIKSKTFIEKKKEITIISKCAYRTNTGYMPGNPLKVNQDSYILNHSITSDSVLFAVADGHGINGEHVSSYIKTRYPSLLSQSPYLSSNPSRAISASCSKLNREIFNKDLDTNFSGSTFISVLLKGKKLWCGNVGDSRALLGRQMSEKSGKGPSNHWISIALSRDHKPDEPDESTRIYSSGGRVEAYQDENGNPFGPCRVWLKTQNVPGLAMSRSFGDKVAGSVGVISDPEILELELTPDDKFIVVGSDGVFEFLKNEDVVKLVVPFWRRGDVEGAAEVLAREAKEKWMKVRDR